MPMLTHPTRSRKQRDRGATAIEFALILPVFILVLYALVVYAILFAAQHTLIQAASEGARAALRHGTTAERQQAACNVARASTQWITSVTGAQPTCQITTNCTNAPCWRIRVVHAYQEHPLVPTPPLLSAFVPARLESDAVVHFQP